MPPLMGLERSQGLIRPNGLRRGPEDVAANAAWDVRRRLARISHQFFGTGFEGAESGGCGLILSPWRRKSTCG
jgi:hypothetical protein